jgi:hypothetical protein
VGREFFDHAADHAAHLLELTLAQDHPPPAAPEAEAAALSRLRTWRLLRVAAWLELAVNLDPHLKTSVLKNLGLAYMHLVRTPDAASVHLPPDRGVPGFEAPVAAWAESFDAAAAARTLQLNRSWALPPPPSSSSSSLAWPHRKASLNVAPVLSGDGSGWKAWAAARFQASWGAFLARHDAPQDGSYESVRAIYNAVAKSAAAAAAPQTHLKAQLPPRADASASSASSASSAAPFASAAVGDETPAPKKKKNKKTKKPVDLTDTPTKKAKQTEQQQGQ